MVFGFFFFFFTVMAHRKLQETCNEEQDSERSAAGLNGSLVGNLAVESYTDLKQLLVACKEFFF